MQSRLSRSVRLSIAMTERIRADYLMRKAAREGSGELERRRKRREQASDAVAQAAATPGDVEDVERVRSLVRETLIEDEILDVQIDTLSPAEFLREVCRKIGRPPQSIPLPLVWDDALEATITLPAETREPSEGWPEPPDESAADRRIGRPPQPDSS